MRFNYSPPIFDDWVYVNDGEKSIVMMDLRSAKIIVDLLNELDNNLDIEEYKSWINQINEYVTLDDDKYIIKFALAYTLQSLRSGVDLDRFKWDY